MFANLSELPEGGSTTLPAGRRRLAASFLLAGFACNVTVLFVPFMDMRIGLSRQPYSLFHTTAMLWSSGLQVLAILVMAFSVVFPFVKLGVLAWLCGAGVIDGGSRRWLALVDRLGKWSMLDVFVVAILIVLVKLGPLAKVEPQRGVYVFALAILLSMITSMYVDYLAKNVK